MTPKKIASETILISNTGFIYIGCGIILFFPGITRGELISSICGCAILLYVLFCFCCAANGVWHWKKARILLSWEGKDQASLKLTETTRFPGRSCIFATAFYESIFRVCPETGYVSSFKISLPVTEPETRHQIAIPPRGIYLSYCTSIVIKDFSGFFQFAILMPESMNPDPLRVLPEIDETANIPLPTGRTGISKGKSTFHRSDELYETRQYMPGDDPRKINWKVSAHTGTPVVREGELLPPPSTEYIFAFNTEFVNRKFKRAVIKKKFDILVSRATFIARSLAAQNKIISVARLNARGNFDITTIKPDDPDAKEALLLAFSEPQPEQTDTTLITKSVSSKNDRIFERDAALLIFTMPENAEIRDLDGISKNSALIVCGPSSHSTRDKSAQQELCQHFSSGGFNVAKI